MSRGAPHPALPMFIYIGTVVVWALVVIAIARSQGGGLTGVGVGGRAQIHSCGRDVTALGLRFQCSGSVGGVEVEPIYSPRDRSGQTVDVLIFESHEISWARGKKTHAERTLLTADHPHDSTGWELFGLIAPFAGLIVGIPITLLVIRLASRDEPDEADSAE